MRSLGRGWRLSRRPPAHRLLGIGLGAAGLLLLVKIVPLGVWPLGVGLWLVWSGLGPILVGGAMVWIGWRMLSAR